MRTSRLLLSTKITSGRMRLARNVAHTGRRETHTEFWWGKLKEGEHWEDTGINEGTILK